jgi:hypothetical protein
MEELVMLKKTLFAAVATAVALGLVGSANAGQPASGKVIDPNTQGAAIVMPYLTTPGDGGVRMTVGTVTNGSDDRAISLHIVWISATDWSSINYDCPLTPLETTYFIFELNPNSDNATVTFECSDTGQDVPDVSATNNVFTRSVNGRDGLMFVAIECQLDDGECETNGDGAILRTETNNILSADFVVMDFGQGLAFSAPAIHMQASYFDRPRDRLYEFNGKPGEYFSFPSLLTTNYIAPDDSITAELLLFTLDGSVGDGPGVNAKISGFAYDDDENPTSGSISFDCVTLTKIDDSPNGFGLNVTRPFGGHLVGHLELFPAVAPRNDAHELLPETGNGDGVRRSLVHGYIIQTIRQGGQFAGGEFGGTMAMNAAWARQLTQGTNALVPTPGDVTSLDARAFDSERP